MMRRLGRRYPWGFARWRRAVVLVAAGGAMPMALLGAISVSATVATPSQEEAAPQPAPGVCPDDPLAALVCQLGIPPLPPPGLPGLLAPPSPPPSAPVRPGGVQPSPPAQPEPVSAVPVPAAEPSGPAAGDTSFLEELLDILTHPLSRDRPGLTHFRPGLPLATPPGGDERSGAHVRPGSTADRHETLTGRIFQGRWAALVPLGCALVIVAGAWLRRPPPEGTDRERLPRLRPCTLAVTGASLIAAATLLTGSAAIPRSPAPPPRTSMAAAPTAVIPAQARRDTLVPPAGGGPPTWAALVAVEEELAAQQEELAAQETEITRITADAAARSAAADHSLASAGRELSLLAELVSAHRLTAAAFVRSLDDEYELYRAVVQDRSGRIELIEAASVAAIPGAIAAVMHDLEVVGTQLEQEAAIARAEAKLAHDARLAPAQLDALRRHQPFVAPEIAPVSQWFGPTDFSLEPPLVYNGVFHRHFHTGIDLAGPLGTPLHAAADGLVVLATSSVDGADRLVGYGHYAVIDHGDGLLTLYAHLDRLAVRTGDVVRQGQVIGLEGSTGWSTGPHVHFEIREGGRLLDPAPFLTDEVGTAAKPSPG